MANVEGTNVSNVLYRNDGGDAFVDVSSGAGVASPSPSASASWVDYDEDGLLDLYVVNYASSGYSGANQLYRNGGDGTFVDVAQLAGLDDGSAGSGGSGAAWGDYDGDGDPDLLYVANYGQANSLYRNEGTTSKWLSVGLAPTVSACRWQRSARNGGGGQSASDAHVRRRHGLRWTERGSGALWVWPDGDECRFADCRVAFGVGDDADERVHERYADAE